MVVFAAASLTDAFTALGNAFDDSGRRFGIEFNFAGSSSLREQILAGAPADVFASANPPNMSALVDAGEASAPTNFAANRLQIAVPPGNPAGVTSLADLADEDRLVGLCAEEVPCGAFARQALERAAVVASVDTNEADVRALLTKIEAGELDVGIVYRSDVRAAGAAVVGIDIPTEINVVATYPIAVLTGSRHYREAEAFVAFVRSPEGQGILASFGFERP